MGSHLSNDSCHLTDNFWQSGPEQYGFCNRSFQCPWSSFRQSQSIAPKCHTSVSRASLITTSSLSTEAFIFYLLNCVTLCILQNTDRMLPEKCSWFSKRKTMCRPWKSRNALFLFFTHFFFFFLQFLSNYLLVFLNEKSKRGFYWKLKQYRGVKCKINISFSSFDSLSNSKN